MFFERTFCTLWFSSVQQNMMLYHIPLMSGKLGVLHLIQLVILNGHLLLEYIFCSLLFQTSSKADHTDHTVGH